MYPVVAMVNRHRMVRVSALALRYLCNSNLLINVWVSKYGYIKEIVRIDVVEAISKMSVMPWDSVVLTAMDTMKTKDFYWFLSWDEIKKLQHVMLPSGRKIVEG